MKPTPGSLSPFQSSSSQHKEKDDNNLEFYVEGGEKVAEKTFDVNDSKTKSSSYDANVSTEPDAKSELAMQKEAGEGTYSTTANSRNDAPIAGETTEPIQKAAQCCDNSCGNCKGPGCGCCSDCKETVEKSDTCDCGKEDCEKCMGIKKEAIPSASTPSVTASADDNDSEPDADEDDIKKNQIQKSLWGGAFSPFIKR